MSRIASSYMSIYFWDGFLNTKDISSRSIRRYTSKLYKTGFIERFQKEASGQKPKPCRLASGGIYYLILTMRIMPYNIINAIFKNYGNDRLFQLFVYPYIKQDTLLQITDIPLTSRLSLYLFQCCREIEDVLTEDIKNKNVMQLRPVQQNILWKESKSERFDAVPVMSIEEFATNCIFISIPQYLPTLIFDLISNAKVGSSDFHILSRDKRFMQKLKETKTKFDNQYTMAIKEQRATFTSSLS